VLVFLFAPLFFVVIEKTLGKHSKEPAAKSAEKTPSGNH